MNVQLLDVPTFRSYEFPITANKVFFAHAASSPLPRCVTDAMMRYLTAARDEGQWEYIYSGMEDETRELAARLLGARPEEIAFVSSTSMGLGIIASGLSWHKGDNVITADGDFPANIYPWLNFKSQGVEVRFIPRHPDGSVTIHDILMLIDKNTRLVSLSSVNYITGYRIDVSAIGRFLHYNGILFCVDAIQGLGAFPIDVTHVDFLASGAHKWLLGPLGTGILYVKKSNLGRINPALAGWKCMASGHRYLEYNLCFLDSARRFEPGGINISGIVGFHAALRLLLDNGIPEIAAKLRRFRHTLIRGLLDKGYDIIGPLEDELSSGITSFSTCDGDVSALRRQLDNSGFVVSLRDGLEGRKVIRVSPHFYNTEEEITRFLEAIPICPLSS